jgi:Predicted metal-sulfur cluster biosynthetic enzyme
MVEQAITPAYIREELKQVKDPEIPTISIVDLGIVTGIDIKEIMIYTLPLSYICWLSCT